MRSVFGLVSLDAGAVLWEKRRVTREQRRRFGYMPEERGLYPRMPIREQMRYFGLLRGLDSGEAGREADRWLERLDLATRAAEPLESLSHGNQQRVQLAVSLVGGPALLILDEPFSGLDPIAAETLTSIIREQADSGVAVVFSSHQLDLVGDVCDDIAIITRGRVVLSGDLNRIRRASSLRYVEIAIDSIIDPAQAEAAIRALPGSSLVLLQGENLKLRVPAETAPRRILDVIESWGRIEHLRIEPPALEDIFREAEQA
jgi:ABC-2 type transport system ATP-binding protein